MTDFKKKYTLEMRDSRGEQWNNEIGKYNTSEIFEEVIETAVEVSLNVFQQFEFDQIEWKITNKNDRNEFKIFTIRDLDDRFRTTN